MLRRSKHDPLARRLRLICSTSWQLFWITFPLSLIGLALTLWQSFELLNIRTLTLILAIPSMIGGLTLVYLRQTRALDIGWAEPLILFILRFFLWIGAFWQLLCSIYLALDWASGQDLLIGLFS